LSMTLTVHGTVPFGKAVRRCGAKPGDKIYVSGDLGAAALAVVYLQREDIDEKDRSLLMKKLQHPHPRIDLVDILQNYASAAIDISDGLSADLNHICTASDVGACLAFEAIPVHPLVRKYQASNAVKFALTGGDDYELCFIVTKENEKAFLAELSKLGLSCYNIGNIEQKPGLRLSQAGITKKLAPRGYSHF